MAMGDAGSLPPPSLGRGLAVVVPVLLLPGIHSSDGGVELVTAIEQSVRQAAPPVRLDLSPLELMLGFS